MNTVMVNIELHFSLFNKELFEISDNNSGCWLDRSDIPRDFSSPRYVHTMNTIHKNECRIKYRLHYS